MTWRARAACATLPLDKSDRLFFGPGKPSTEALAMCSNCTVRTDCYDFASNARIPDGIYGGEAGADRRARLGISDYEDQIGFAAVAFPQPDYELDDGDLPGMWSTADFLGGKSDAAA